VGGAFRHDPAMRDRHVAAALVSTTHLLSCRFHLLNTQRRNPVFLQHHVTNVDGSDIGKQTTICAIAFRFVCWCL
jgi:hypothetical protein